MCLSKKTEGADDNCWLHPVCTLSAPVSTHKDTHTPKIILPESNKQDLHCSSAKVKRKLPFCESNCNYLIIICGFLLSNYKSGETTTWLRFWIVRVPCLLMTYSPRGNNVGLETNRTEVPCGSMQSHRDYMRCIPYHSSIICHDLWAVGSAPPEDPMNCFSDSSFQSACWLNFSVQRTQSSSSPSRPSHTWRSREPVSCFFSPVLPVLRYWMNGQSNFNLIVNSQTLFCACD